MLSGGFITMRRRISHLLRPVYRVSGIQQIMKGGNGVYGGEEYDGGSTRMLEKK
jgi:hypothetical protein